MIKKLLTEDLTCSADRLLISTGSICKYGTAVSQNLFYSIRFSFTCCKLFGSVFECYKYVLVYYHKSYGSEMFTLIVLLLLYCKS